VQQTAVSLYCVCMVTVEIGQYKGYVTAILVMEHLLNAKVMLPLVLIATNYNACLYAPCIIPALLHTAQCSFVSSRLHLYG
jgi:hypothetical protein